MSGPLLSLEIEAGGDPMLIDRVARGALSIGAGRVGRHLRQRIDHDGLQPGRPALSIPAIRVLGARYNRGMGLTLQQIGTNTSYGDFIVRNLGRFASLLT